MTCSAHELWRMLPCFTRQKFHEWRYQLDFCPQLYKIKIKITRDLIDLFIISSQKKLGVGIWRRLGCPAVRPFVRPSLRISFPEQISEIHGGGIFFILHTHIIYYSLRGCVRSFLNFDLLKWPTIGHN